MSGVIGRNTMQSLGGCFQGSKLSTVSPAWNADIDFVLDGIHLHVRLNSFPYLQIDRHEAIVNIKTQSVIRFVLAGNQQIINATKFSTFATNKDFLCGNDDLTGIIKK